MHARSRRSARDEVDGIETRGDVRRHDSSHRPPGRRRLHAAVQGLPDDLCQCPHWGYVTAGSITVRYADGTEETTRRRVSTGRRHTGWTDEASPSSSSARPTRSPGSSTSRPLSTSRPGSGGRYRRSHATDAASRERRTRSPRPARASRCDWQGAYDATSRPHRTTTRRTRRSGSTCSRTRRGGWAASTSASRLARARTRATTSSETGARAGQCAVWLYEHYCFKARPAIAGGWLRRARRALEDDPESVEYGALRLREAETAHGSGDLEASAAAAREVVDLGRRLRSPDLEAEALQTLGRVLIDAGDPAEGLGHPRRGDAVRGRRPAPSVLDGQGVLQPHQRLRSARRSPPRGRVERGDLSLGAAPSARRVSRVVSCAPGVVAAVARRMGRGRGTSRACVRGARHAQRDERRRRLRGDR